MSVTGDGLDSARLRDLTKEELIDLLEDQSGGGIRVSFSGKSNARRLARKVRPRVQRHCLDLSCGTLEEQANNLLMEGDNLQGMVTLYRERAQIDLVLTDPPYNTGKDFRYNDRWEEDPNDPGLGKLVPEDDGARHTKWMRFMWPRLQLMREMLKPTGVLAICIDHRELFRLGQMLDELFGEQNRIAIINWQKSYSPRNDNTHVSTATEYILVYARDIDQVRTELLPRKLANNTRYGNPDHDPQGNWREHDLTAATPSRANQYGIQSPFTGQVYYPPGTRSWTHPKRNIKQWLEQWGTKYREQDIGDGRAPALLVVGGAPGAVPVVVRERALARFAEPNWPFIWFGLTATGGPRVKRYFEKVKKGIVPMTYWADEDYDEPLELGSTSWDHEQSGRSQTGIKELNAILGPGHGFETVKPLQLFKKILTIWCPPNGLVLDPFAGSGTTGHAVLDLNATTGANRRFFLIEQGRPERGDSYARSLTAQRLRRVITGEWKAGKRDPLPGGFRFVTLDKKVDANVLLRMEREEMIDTVIASYFDSNRRRGPGLIPLTDAGYRYLVARNPENEGIYLVWDGADMNTDFNEDVYEDCSKEAATAGLKPVYHVYARLYLYQTGNVYFYQIPDRILADFGLNIRSDSFNEVAG